VVEPIGIGDTAQTRSILEQFIMSSIAVIGAKIFSRMVRKTIETANER
jgi:hypothetical protein